MIPAQERNEKEIKIVFQKSTRHLSLRAIHIKSRIEKRRRIRNISYIYKKSTKNI